jgi:hypothetical protein
MKTIATLIAVLVTTAAFATEPAKPKTFSKPATPIARANDGSAGEAEAIAYLAKMNETIAKQAAIESAAVSAGAACMAANVNANINVATK